MQQIVWRAAADGKQLDSATLTEEILAQLGIGAQAAGAWVAGETVLTEYVTSTVEYGDALTEEGDAVVASRRAVLPLLEARLQRRIDHFEQNNHKTVGRSGKQLKSKGRRPWTRSTLLGSVTTNRRWYVGPKLGGFSPAEQEIGLPADDSTARLAEVVTMMATTVSEDMASRLDAGHRDQQARGAGIGA